MRRGRLDAKTLLIKAMPKVAKVNGMKELTIEEEEGSALRCQPEL